MSKKDKKQGKNKPLKLAKRPVRALTPEDLASAAGGGEGTGIRCLTHPTSSPCCN
jgi:hypothetical protein